MILTPVQIFETARKAGFPSAVAVTMTAIALRESAGDPNAFNGNVATGDQSYGLWQINMLDANVRQLLTTHGITIEHLWEPATNAKEAFLLWGGKNSNLNLAWYIDRGDYQARYLAHLPAAQAAALASPLGIT